jgi:hypothetical protein
LGSLRDRYNGNDFILSSKEALERIASRKRTLAMLDSREQSKKQLQDDENDQGKSIDVEVYLRDEKSIQNIGPINQPNEEEDDYFEDD